MSFHLPNHSLTLSLMTYRAPYFVRTSNEEKTEKDPSFKALQRTSVGQGMEKQFSHHDFLSTLLLPILYLIFFFYQQ